MRTMHYKSDQRISYPIIVLLGAALISTSVSYADGDGPATVVIVGHLISGPPVPYRRDNIIYGPVAECAEALGLKAHWDPDKDKLQLVRADGTTITVESGDRFFWRGSKKVALHGMARAVNNMLVAPLAPILEALGTEVHSDFSHNTLKANLLISEPTVRADESGLAVEIAASGQVSGQVKYLDDPPRAFIDLAGAQCQPAMGRRYLGRNGLWRLRWARFSADPAMVRFVLDLQEHQEVRWQPHPDGYGGSLIVGECDGDEPIIEPCWPRLTAVRTCQDGEDATSVELEFSLPVEWSYDVLSPPNVIRFDIRDAQLPDGKLRKAIRSDFVRGLEAIPNQDGIQLTVYLKELIGFEVGNSLDPMCIRLGFRRRQLGDQTIVIDPGHGGGELGARGRSLVEKDVNLDVAMRVASELLRRGISVALTRDSDTAVDLFARPRLAEELGAQVFVSIHCNAMPRPDTNWGTETYYYTPQSKILAIIMHQHLLKALGRKDNGVRQARFVVVRETQTPAVLLELMYLNHTEEEQLLAEPQVRQAAAEAVVAGLQQYFEGERAPTSLSISKGE